MLQKNKKNKILKKLKQLEKKHNVKIIWAIESGSRAWKFESKDSDYDIRCMHVGNKKDYLSLHLPAKQINYLKKDIDIESWDIKKFTELTLNSNPQIAEWLRSPIIYIDSKVREEFRKFFDTGCSLRYLQQHYLNMAKQNYYKYLRYNKNEKRKDSCKKYLYVLRAIACSEFIKKEKQLPPLPYQEVLTYFPKFVQEFFQECIKQKNKTEKAKIKSNPKVTKFIEKQISKSLNKQYKKEFNFNKKLAKQLEEYMVGVIERN